MNSNDIYENVAEKIIELSCDGGIKIAGIPVVIAFQSKLEQADFYRRALYDYSIEKLFETDENKVIVEDLGFIFARFESQFTSVEERSAFYNNYVCSILSAYNELTGKKITWRRVKDDAEGEYPAIVDDYVTRESMDNCDVALWLFRCYEKTVDELKKQDEKDNAHKTHKKTRWGKWWK